MKVVDLPQTDLANVALQLRRLADWVETMKGENMTCVVVFGRADQSVNIYGYGARASGLELQGWLARAAYDVGGCVSRASSDTSSS